MVSLHHFEMRLTLCEVVFLVNVGPWHMALAQTLGPGWGSRLWDTLDSTLDTFPACCTRLESKMRTFRGEPSLSDHHVDHDKRPGLGPPSSRRIGNRRPRRRSADQREPSEALVLKTDHDSPQHPLPEVACICQSHMPIVSLGIATRLHFHKEPIWYLQQV